MLTVTPEKTGLSQRVLDQLKTQARDYEGVFLNTLTKEMFGSLDTSASAMGGGFGEETWRSVQAEEIANAIARSGGIGLAESILPDLIVAQQRASNASSSSIPMGTRAYDRR